MVKQDDGKVTTLQRPATDDPKAWKAYWEAQGQPWRTEPEIDSERQRYLIERRAIVPVIKQGIYPFKKIKLSRADVEWLLATHENGQGPVDWSNESQQKREGLDLRGANLSKINLSNLPLARTRGGLDGEDWQNATKGQRQAAALSLEGANLQGAHLEGSALLKANLQEAFIVEAHLEGADLNGAHLEDANLQRTQLDGSIIRGAFFDAGTYLADISFGSKKSGFITLHDVRWNNVNEGIS